MKFAKGAAYARALLSELRTTNVFDVRSVAEQLDLDVREVDVDTFDGALVRAKGLPLGAVVIRQSIREPGRKNFTIAHEIGHFVLPSHDQADLVCTSEEVGNWSDIQKEVEREADEFAAELLMPADAASSVVKASAPSLHVVEQMAARFSSSFSAASWRYCDLTSERCAIVWNEGDRVKWFKKSAEFAAYVRKGPVEKGTYAYDCFRQGTVPTRPEPVPADLWIDSENLEDGAQVWEESRWLPNYASVITLLWLKDRIEKYSRYDEKEQAELDPEEFKLSRKRWPKK